MQQQQGSLYNAMGPQTRQCTGALRQLFTMLVGSLCLLGPWASAHWAHALRRPWPWVLKTEVLNHKAHSNRPQHHAMTDVLSILSLKLTILVRNNSYLECWRQRYCTTRHTLIDHTTMQWQMYSLHLVSRCSQSVSRSNNRSTTIIFKTILTCSPDYSCMTLYPLWSLVRWELNAAVTDRSVGALLAGRSGFPPCLLLFPLWVSSSGYCSLVVLRQFKLSPHT